MEQKFNRVNFRYIGTVQYLLSSFFCKFFGFFKNLRFKRYIFVNFLLFGKLNLLHSLLLPVEPEPDKMRLNASMFTLPNVKKPSLIVHSCFLPIHIIKLIAHLHFLVTLTVYYQKQTLKIVSENLLVLLNLQYSKDITYHLLFVVIALSRLWRINEVHLVQDCSSLICI